MVGAWTREGATRSEILRYSASTSSNLDQGLAGRRVLEVGSGRGGGAAYSSKHLQPAHYTGPESHSPRSGWPIAHGVPDRLAFVTGDAERLIFDVAMVDNTRWMHGRRTFSAGRRRISTLTAFVELR